MLFRDAEQHAQAFFERAVDLGLTSQLDVGVQDFFPTVHKGLECAVPVHMQANSLSSQDLQPAPCSNYTHPSVFSMTLSMPRDPLLFISSNPEYLFLFSMTLLTKNLMEY